MYVDMSVKEIANQKRHAHVTNPRTRATDVSNELYREIKNKIKTSTLEVKYNHKQKHQNIPPG